MIIFAIESSHDDTSLAILENSKVVCHLTISQSEIHERFGGTVPELASREHSKNFAILLNLLQKKYDLKKVDYIAYTAWPGLIGALQMGYLFANAVSMVLNKPLIPVNHLTGHFFSVAINQELQFPVLGLIISGGHSELVFAQHPTHWKVIGETQDDALGEIYDKVGRQLKLKYPAGKEVDLLAQSYKGSDFYKFTKPSTQQKFDFSFSGLKTQAINLIKREKENLEIQKFCASFQKHICDYLKEKMQIAIQEFNPRSISLSGGVSANLSIRKMFKELHPHAYVPLQKFTQDNAAMIAKAAEIALSFSKSNGKNDV